MTRRLAFSLVLLILSCPTPAQDDLSAAVRAADAAMFRAFNECDVAAMASMYADDLEFFHDTGGLDDKARTLEKTRDLCAG